MNFSIPDGPWLFRFITWMLNRVVHGIKIACRKFSDFLTELNRLKIGRGTSFFGLIFPKNIVRDRCPIKIFKSLNLAQVYLPRILGSHVDFWSVEADFVCHFLCRVFLFWFSSMNRSYLWDDFCWFCNRPNATCVQKRFNKLIKWYINVL